MTSAVQAESRGEGRPRTHQIGLASRTVPRRSERATAAASTGLLGFARQLTQPSPETRSGARLRPSQTLTLGGWGKTARPQIAGGS